MTKTTIKTYESNSDTVVTGTRGRSDENVYFETDDGRKVMVEVSGNGDLKVRCWDFKHESPISVSIGLSNISVDAEDYDTEDYNTED